MKKNDKKKKKTTNKKKIEEEKSFTFNGFEVCWMIILSICFGMIIGFLVTYRRNPMSGEEVSDELQEFIQVYDNIRENSYSDAKDKELLEAAISGMVGSLGDPYSVYMNEEATSEFNESIDGTYTGIGAAVQTVDGKNIIAQVYKGLAAEEAGLKVDDVVIKVDGKDVTEMNSTEISDLVRGKVNTKVKVTVLRKDKEKTFTIKRTKVELNYTHSRVIEKNDKKIGYLFIESFSSNIFKQVEKELKSLEEKNIDSLIIDLRENPGGYLAQARKVLDLFFDKKTVLYQIENNNGVKKYYASDSEKRTYPIVLLGSNSTASAAEVVISCFMDNYKKATYVGETTYGKGTVQRSILLSTGSSVKYTTQKWLTSKGKSIDKKGIQPDEVVLLNSEYYDNPCDETDKQLQAALDILAK